MKKVISISLVFIYLFSATELNQLFKLPLLFEHYTEHRSEHNDLSFLNFIASHYFSDNSKYPDYDKDMKLPFKSHHGCLSSNLVVVTPGDFTALIAKIYFTSENTHNSHRDTFYSSAHLSNIWQPPKNS